MEGEEMLPESGRKRSRAGVVADDDRLSALPDGVLHVILSFLPAPEMVRTTVLSRRWRDLWCYTPYIKIDQREFGIMLDDPILEEKWAKFEDFTTDLLLFHYNAVSLDEFQLCAQLDWGNQYDVERWVRRGVKYCPRVLVIETPNFDGELSLELPHLGSSFSHLKRLHFFNVKLCTEFAELLCSSCSVLEEMILSGCNFFFHDIASSTLKKLELDYCVHDTLHPVPVVITAPCLESFQLYIQSQGYQGYQGGISLCRMGSLVKASIHIECTDYFPEENQRKLLASLFNVTTLELHGFDTMAFLNENPDKFAIYSTMRSLSLGSCFLDEYDLNDKLQALGSFLQNAPCLEKLTLGFCMFDVYPDMEWDIERKCITLHRDDMKTFQCPKLKLIEVSYVYDLEHRLIELVWCLGVVLPDARIKLSKI